MYEIRKTEQFDNWFKSIRESIAQKRLLARLRRVSLGSLGDVSPIANGIWEMREHFGVGWRMYYFAVFDAVDYLKTDKDMADYLNAVLDDGDPALFVAAIGDIAKAKGMMEISKKSGVTREALYRALKVGSQPRFETVAKVINALGMRLTVHS